MMNPFQASPVSGYRMTMPQFKLKQKLLIEKKIRDIVFRNPDSRTSSRIITNLIFSVAQKYAKILTTQKTISKKIIEKTVESGTEEELIRSIIDEII